MSNYASIILNLQHSVQEEHKAAAVDRLRAKSADSVTKRLYLEIMAEEMHHARQYTARLAVVRRLQKRGK